MINWEQNSWERTTLLTDRAVQMMTARTCIFSDPVLLFGKNQRQCREPGKRRSIGFKILLKVESWIESIVADPRRESDYDD